MMMTIYDDYGTELYSFETTKCHGFGIKDNKVYAVFKFEGDKLYTLCIYEGDDADVIYRRLKFAINFFDKREVIVVQNPNLDAVKVVQRENGFTVLMDDKYKGDSVRQ